MIEFEEIDYAAIITVELPGMDRPATVTLTLKPPDAVEVAPGQVKALRDCTLSDLQAFADALEAELWEQYRGLTLSQLAATEQAKLKITILGEADEPLSDAQERWLQQTAAMGEAEEAPLADEGEVTAPQAEAEPEPAVDAASDAEEKPEPPTDSADATEEVGAAEPEAETGFEDESEAPAVSKSASVEEDAVDTEQPPPDADVEAVDVKEEESVDVAEETDDVDVEAGPSETQAPIEEQLAAPPPVETPVVEGVEPIVAPVPTPPSEGDVRVAGLRRPAGHPTPAAVDILINEPAFREAQEHALSSLDREVAGMLVGPQPEKQPDGRYVVHVTDVIAARHTRMSGASVTYTPESWRYVTDVLDERYPDREAIIVGWYHTHPGFGIFLSGMDLFIHQNFFTQTWHVALVLDPRANRSGFFCWNRQQTAVQPYEFPWPRWAAGSW